MASALWLENGHCCVDQCECPKRVPNCYNPNYFLQLKGHSPAGGCLLAISCDYRVMVGGKFRIGLNETQLGIVAPYWFRDSMINTVGVRQTEMALQLGTLFSSEEALKIGLIDVEAPDQATANALAESKMKEFLKIPGMLCLLLMTIDDH